MKARKMNQSLLKVSPELNRVCQLVHSPENYVARLNRPQWVESSGSKLTVVAPKRMPTTSKRC